MWRQNQEKSELLSHNFIRKNKKNSKIFQMGYSLHSSLGPVHEPSIR